MVLCNGAAVHTTRNRRCVPSFSISQLCISMHLCARRKMAYAKVPFRLMSHLANESFAFCRRLNARGFWIVSLHRFEHLSADQSTPIVTCYVCYYRRILVIHCFELFFDCCTHWLKILSFSFGQKSFRVHCDERNVWNTKSISEFQWKGVHNVSEYSPLFFQY